ncbi:MAG TPA: 16S rRNA (adenine(1518)-N(6)/adenine(1519)-N(6))-dimethyltransferase RsmA [Acidimicrobiales bacterium]|nr:16S rRNA (adenine(1518)-N(6)/adenine(1519)-N(6))-dimethyltransferase RsmA [Acidimicrobiales bacterium]
MTLSGPEIHRLLSEHGIHPSKALGQNFVADPNTVRRIVRLGGVSAGSRVLEIGPGLGSLTLALVEAGASVVAVEIDRRLAAALREVLQGAAGVRVVEGDALRLDWRSWLDDGALPSGAPWILVANLPYRVATPVVLHALEEAPEIGSQLVMVQREVADRLVATPNTPAYGAVSVRVGYFAEAAIVGQVPRGVFIPRPKVESALVRIVRRDAPAVDPALVSYARFDAVVRAGFAHRRKMLRRALAGVVSADAFEAAGVAPTARAEDLDVARWGRLAAETGVGAHG